MTEYPTKKEIVVDAVVRSNLVYNSPELIMPAINRVQATDIFVPSVPITHYVMRARDLDCGTPTFRYWTVINTPDTTAAQYIGARCGATPLSDIIVVSTYQTI